MAKKPFFNWNQYGLDVLAGKIPVCSLVKKVVKRHYDDLKNAHKRGYYFSEDHAQYALKSFLFVKHSKGEFAGKQFVPSPWQQFWVAVAFGWLRMADGSRRFREVYQEVARKNGKTTMLAGLGIYMLMMDGEAGAEVYAAATKMDQAKLLFRETQNMIAGSPLLSRKVKVNRDVLEAPLSSRFVPLGRDSKSMDGLNPNCAIIDELHAHKTSEIYDVLKSALGGRKQPLIWIITTAGFDLSAFGYEQHVYAEKVASGKILDDELLPIIYTVDDVDKWDDPVEWFKANPNMGVSVYEDNLAADCERAKRQPIQQVNFKTKRLNIWLSSGTTWIPVEDWRKCGDSELKLEDFKGERCWIGIDLAEKRDIAALCLGFKRNGKFYLFFRMYLNSFEAEKQENQHFRRYQQNGELIVTDGNATDFDVIRADIERFSREFDLVEVPYDPRFSSYFATKLFEQGIPMLEMTQTSTHFTEPVIELENLILEGKVVHDANSMMEWMMSNVVIKISKFSGLKHPTKEGEKDKIDGVVAMLMALSRMMADQEIDIDDAIAFSTVI